MMQYEELPRILSSTKYITQGNERLASRFKYEPKNQLVVVYLTVTHLITVKSKGQMGKLSL